MTNLSQVVDQTVGKLGSGDGDWNGNEAIFLKTFSFSSYSELVLMQVQRKWNSSNGDDGGWRLSL